MAIVVREGGTESWPRRHDPTAENASAQRGNGALLSLQTVASASQKTD
jgi:hypothetical protein